MKTKKVFLAAILFLTTISLSAQYATLGSNLFTGDQRILKGYRLCIGDSNAGQQFRVGLEGSTDTYIDIPGILHMRNIALNGGTPFMTIHSSGNVCLGTFNSTYKLNVGGTIRATEVRVESGWADFVFDADYKLPALSEVKAHIEEHRHLPGIPSEAEVVENGIGLAEITTKMMQKIEELTLYVIQQNEEIEFLKAQIKQSND